MVLADIWIKIGDRIFLFFSYVMFSINPKIKAYNIFIGYMCIRAKTSVVISIDILGELNFFSLL
jgi:hypothetical protein